MERKYSAKLYERRDKTEDYAETLKIVTLDDSNRITIYSKGSFEEKFCGSSGLPALFDEIENEIRIGVNRNPEKSYRVEIEVEKKENEE